MKDDCSERAPKAGEPRVLPRISATFAAGTVALILAVSLGLGGAVGSSATIHGKSTAVTSVTRTDGCATAVAPPPVMSVSTGIGTLGAKASSVSCTNSAHGAGDSSYGSALSGVGITQYSKLGANASLMTINYSVSAKVFGSGTGTLTGCPTHTTHSHYKDRSFTKFTWVWLNATSQLCYSQATWFMGVEFNYCTVQAGIATCNDETTYFATNTTGNSVNYLFETFNYSNGSAIGQTNHTYSRSSNFTYTPNATTIKRTGSVSFTVSWKKGTKVDLSPMVIFIAETSIEQEVGAYAKCSVLASGTGYGVAITGFYLS